MARLARELRERLLLRDAVWSGEVTVRQAEAILPVARGEAEEVWVARARSGETVRRLKAAVKAATGSEHDEDEAWERVSVPVSPEARPVVDKAMELAGKLLGHTAPKWQRVEAICEEYLGAHEVPDEIAGSLCATHHLHGVHKGWIRVRGKAPLELDWELGERRPDRLTAAGTGALT